jgi:hypothetical protein
MIAAKESHGDRLMVRFDGTFNPAAERELHCILAETPLECHVTADFRRVRDFQDVAVAMLARDLAQNVGRVELLGLCRHQFSILRHFGIADLRKGRASAEST